MLEQEEQKLVMRLAQAYLDALQAEEQLRLVAVQRVAYTAQLDHFLDFLRTELTILLRTPLVMILGRGR